ncbi:Tyrosine-protein phosphatase non-receptor type 13 [Zootermopsis nevadensis]|uniref:Tyrosine-protein phosphatase non-receptor type 13 n=1 Tax=Zootermopsis nevadensis TaxID=136037 RepID=A0A067RET8_ZOONE|nr:Tyrosine-protein phosphatase non-receptor type 13 [Zootermopsis nevadensis]
MYREVLATPPQASKCLPSNQNVIHPNTVMDSAQRTNSFPKEYQRRDTEERNTKINKSYSLASKTDRGSRLAPQRAPSRLYRTASSSRDIEPCAKYCCPNTCIGPEFIIKATKPSKCIHIKGVKAACRKKVVVILLNGQKIDVTCDQNTTARQIFEVVVISEGLEDNFTLGLAALLGGDFAFLPHKTKLRKVAPVGWRGDSKKDAVQSYTFTLYLRVKFFMPSLRGVRNWTMKHLLYLQLRRNLLEQQIQCNIDQHIALSGLALQSEFGDYLDQEHGHGAYFLLEHYIPESLLVQHEDEQALRAQMQLLHKKRHGLDPGRAEEIYINLVQMLKGYGTHFYNAVLETKDEYSHEMLLAIDSQGLALYKNHRNERHLHEFLIWKRIQLLSYNKQYLFIMPQYDNKGTLKPTKYKLQMDHKKSFYVFHLASFHHQISMKLRFDVNSLRSLTAEFGVSIRNHLGRESRLYHIENNETGNSRRQQCVLIAPCNVKHTQKAVAVIQRDNKADVANVVPFCDRLGVSQYLKQINIEEHQNKENENPEAQKVHYCNSYTLAVRNEQRKATNSRTDIQDHVCSALSRNTVNDIKGTSFPYSE